MNNYEMDTRKGPAIRALHTAAILAIRGVIVVTLSSVVLMTRLLPGFSLSKE